MKKKSATAFAPATIGNVAVGFDILGLALQGLGDTVTVSRTDKPGQVEIKKITGSSISGFAGANGHSLPLDPGKNTATVGLLQLLQDINADFGFEVSIKKGIPLGSGMGGSAASAVGASVAANALLKTRLNKIDLMRYALMGEAVASGGMHGDNVAPCLFGGLVLVRQTEPVTDVIPISLPKKILCVIAHPHVRLDTKDSRAVLKSDVPLHSLVKQSASLAGFIAACFTEDIALMGRTLEDTLIEPQRQHLIPGFAAVKKAALENGALGCSISGAGPAVFALTADPRLAKKIKGAMVAAFNEAGASPVNAWISPLNKKGAQIL